MDKDTHKRGDIFNEGDDMSSFFFEVGLRINANANIHRMDTAMMEGIAGDRHYVFQQDGALAHGANTVLYTSKFDALKYILKFDF